MSKFKAAIHTMLWFKRIEKTNRMERDKLTLRSEGITPYDAGSERIRVYSFDQFRTYDYYPESGKWMCRNDGRWQYGIKKLIKHVKGEH